MYNPNKDFETFIKSELPVCTGIPLHLYNILLTNIIGAQEYHISLTNEWLKMKCDLTGTIKIKRIGEFTVTFKLY